MEIPHPTRSAPQYPIESVDKALQLLQMLGSQHELRLTEVHAALGIGKSRAHRLLAMLVFHDFAVQDAATKAYRPGPALIEIGLAAVRRMDVRAVARPFLEEIAAHTGETVHLGVLEGGNVRFVDGVESEMALRVAHRVGRVLPAYTTSLGKSMLAALPDAAVIALYPSENLAAVTPYSIKRRSELLVELDHVRSRGYAVNHAESEEGVSSIGVALPAIDRSAPAALSVAAPTPRFGPTEVERAARITLDAASRLAASLL